MKKHYAMWLLASGLVLWTNLEISDAAAPCRDTAAPGDPRLDMIVVPRAMDPHSSPDNQANAVECRHSSAVLGTRPSHAASWRAGGHF